jgi:3-hydroxymyristoyl/3-hydroxydecanoyl-(acyl carrier protein) dehydratase
MTEHPGALPPVSSVLPHRAPFLFIDQVVELTGDRVVAVRTFRPDEPFFLGHFPGRPMVPGVVLIEGLAQAMAYHSLLHHPSREIFLVGIDHARFRSPVGFGVEVRFEIRVGEQRFGMAKGEGEVRTAARQVARATLLGYTAEPGTSPPDAGDSP